ncbi:MAG: lipopolysaccharide heptosyltransferase II [Pseudomonadales bacterium]|nr:lipopolysaccharide heptosyltransferase II [Pseudomonadales bacterium]
MRILVIGPSWVGDMIMAQSLFITLQQQYAGRLQLDVLAPAWSKPLLARMPEVDNALELPFGHGDLSVVERYRLGKALRARRYDQAILLPNSFKSALVPVFASIPLRTGWRGEMRALVLNDSRPLDSQALPLMVQRFVALALPRGAKVPAACPKPALRNEAAWVEKTLAALGVPKMLSSAAYGARVASSGPGNRLVLCPGAEFGDAKQWPATHYAGLAALAIAQGWQVLIAGSANDAQVAAEIVKLVPAGMQHGCINLAGKTTLDQVVDVLASATAVVSNDSGLMHIAAAVQRPLVALYGSSSATFTPPLHEQAQVLTTDIACRPCFQRRCPLGHKRCLTDIQADRVWQSVQDMVLQSTTVETGSVEISGE